MPTPIESPARLAFQGLLDYPKYIGLSVLLSALVGAGLAHFSQHSRSTLGVSKVVEIADKLSAARTSKSPSVVVGAEKKIALAAHQTDISSESLEQQESVNANPSVTSDAEVRSVAKALSPENNGPVMEVAPLASELSAVPVASSEAGGGVPPTQKSANTTSEPAPLENTSLEIVPSSVAPNTSDVDPRFDAPNSAAADHISAKLSKAAMDAEADRDQRRSLEFRIEREREVATYKIKLKLKQKELRRVTQLHERDLVSTAVLEKTRGELELLRTEQSATIRSLESQLEQVNRRIRERAEKRKASDADQTQVVKRHAWRLVAFRLPDTDESEVSDSESEGSKLISQQSVKDRDSLKSTSLPETPIAAPRLDRSIAGPPPRNQSNTKSLFAAGFLGTLFCLLGPLFYKEWRTAADASPETGSIFGLPVLGRLASRKVTRSDPERATEQLGLAALKVCVTLDLRNGVLTIANDKQAGDASVVHAVAQKLRHEGSSVVIASASELVQSIDEDVIADTDKAVSAGRVRLRRMKDQSDYVLVSASLFDKPFDLETAACFSDAVVLVTPKENLRSPKTQRIVAELAELPTRVLGVVVES